MKCKANLNDTNYSISYLDDVKKKLFVVVVANFYDCNKYEWTLRNFRLALISCNCSSQNVSTYSRTLGLVHSCTQWKERAKYASQDDHWAAQHTHKNAVICNTMILAYIWQLRAAAAQKKNEIKLASSLHIFWNICVVISKNRAYKLAIAHISYVWINLLNWKCTHINNNNELSTKSNPKQNYATCYIALFICIFDDDDDEWVAAKVYYKWLII